MMWSLLLICNSWCSSNVPTIEQVPNLTKESCLFAVSQLRKVRDGKDETLICVEQAAPVQVISKNYEVERSK